MVGVTFHLYRRKLNAELGYFPFPESRFENSKTKIKLMIRKQSENCEVSLVIVISQCCYL